MHGIGQIGSRSKHHELDRQSGRHRDCLTDENIVFVIWRHRRILRQTVLTVRGASTAHSVVSVNNTVNTMAMIATIAAIEALR